MWTTMQESHCTNETKAWFWGLLCHMARERSLPIVHEQLNICIWTFYGVPILSEEKVCDACHRESEKITKIMQFHWWKPLDDMHRVNQWSFLSWAEINRSTFHEDVRRQSLPFRSQWPWPLNFWPQICSRTRSYLCPVSTVMSPSRLKFIRYFDFM